jgi:hypothetical protein
VVIDTANTGATEEYDGSTWATITPGLNTARRALAGAGIQTAALAFGGEIQEDHLIQQQQKNMNGSSWTSNPKFKYGKTRFRRLQELKQQH